MPSAGAAKWKDPHNVHEWEIIDRTAESEKLGAIIVSAKFTGWR